MENSERREVTLPTGWVRTNLENVAVWGSGGTPSRKNAVFFKGNIPWVKTGELGSKHIYKAEEQITQLAIAKSSAKIFPKGSVGIAMYGATIGRLSIWGIEASTNQACAVGQATPELLFNEFLYYFLLSEKRDLVNAGKGGAQPNISQGTIKDWIVNLPPLNEQHRIVAKIEELFSELDNGIESLKKAREQLKVYRQAVLKHAFAGKLTAKWREENKDKLEDADTLLARIKTEREAHYQKRLADWQKAFKKWNGKGKKPTKPKKPKELAPLKNEELADLPEVPESWRWVKYGEFVDESQNGLSKRSGNSGVDYKVLRLADIDNGMISIQSPRRITMTNDEIEKYQLQKNDLVCIRVNGSVDLVGRLVLVRTNDDWAFCDHFIRFRQFYSLLDAAYIKHYFDTQQVRLFIRLNMVSSAGQNTVSQATIMALAIPFCPIAEQGEIVEEIESCLSTIEQMEQDIDSGFKKSEALRQSILKRAFSGQLVPQNPNDEPASALLERIKAEKAEQTANKPEHVRSKKKTKKMVTT